MRLCSVFSNHRHGDGPHWRCDLSFVRWLPGRDDDDDDDEHDDDEHDDGTTTLVLMVMVAM